MVQDIIDVLGVSNVDLVRLSEEGVVPDLDEGIVSHAEEEMTIVLEVDRIEPVSVERLHFHFDRHLGDVVSPDGSVLENHPQLFLIEFQLLYDFASEQFATQLQASQFPQIDMCSAVAYDGYSL